MSTTYVGAETLVDDIIEKLKYNKLNSQHDVYKILINSIFRLAKPAFFRGDKKKASLASRNIVFF